MQFLFAASLFFQITAFVRAVHSRLRAPWFIAYLVLSIVLAITLFIIPNGRMAYAVIWIAGQLGKIILEVLMCFEAFRLMCRQYPGIGKFARWLLLCACAIAIALTALSLQADMVRFPRVGIPWILLVKALQRYLVTAIALVLILVQIFFARYRAPWPPNVRWHARLLTIYMALFAASHLIYTVTGGQQKNLHDMVLLGCEALCLAGWSVVLSKEGQKLPASRYVSDEEIRHAEAEIERFIVGAKQLRADRR